MGRVSSKINKTIYQKKREELGLTREKAGELLDSISPERIEKIENENAKIIKFRNQLIARSKKREDK